MEIVINNLSKNYGKKSALKNVSVTIHSGMYGLLGRNGAGKTSLMRILATLSVPSSGEISMNGIPIKETTKIREIVGYLPQDFSFYRNMSVYGAMDYLGLLSNIPDKVRKERISALLEQVNLKENVRTKVKALSGGMKRRLGIAQALLHNPQILIVDEPTAGLDVMARNEMLDMLRDYMEEDEERSILVSSHISTDLETLCDNIYMINEGNIILHEETDRLLSNYAILKVDEEQSKTLDPQYIIKMKKESYGYACLTDQKQFYLENYPKIVVEKGTIDQIITLMIQGV